MTNACRNGDTNTHGGGAITASNERYNVNSRLISTHFDGAAPDGLCFPVGPPHCYPATAEGSKKFFVGNQAVHRKSDQRICGATNASYSPNFIVG